MSGKRKPRERKPLPADPDQEFLVRGRQLQIIRDCVLPRVDGEVTGMVLKAVLRVLDDRIGSRNKECWPAQATIAREAGINRRHAQRALAALEELSLIYVRRGAKAGGGRGGCVNHYRIIWNELALRCPEQPIHQPAERDQCASTGALVSPDQSDNRRDQCANSARPMRQFGATNAPALAHEAPIEAPIEAPTTTGATNAPMAEDWAAVVADFRHKQGTSGMELAAEHLAAGFTASEFRKRLGDAWEIAELPENRGKFISPAGAVRYYLRNESWPREQVVTAEQRARRDVEAAVADQDRLREEMLAVARENREMAYGPFLDALTEPELLDLIARTPKLQDPFFHRWLGRRPPAGAVRELMLKQLAETFDERKSP